MFVEVHAGFRGDVLGADDLTVSLKSLELEELGSREELQGKKTSTEAEGQETLMNTGLCRSLSYLHDFRVTYVQRLGASAVQILHDQLKRTTRQLNVDLCVSEE